MAKNLAAVRDYRRARLAEMLDEMGQQSLAEKTGLAPSYLWQMAKGLGAQKRGVSDENATKIERALGKPQGWLSGEPAAQSQSLPMRLDPAILAESIAALRQVAKRRGWAYDPEMHAESTCYAYELWHELPSQPSTADVIDIGERIAERLRQEMENGNGGNQSRQGAGAGADDRGQSGQAGRRKARVAGGSQ